MATRHKPAPPSIAVEPRAGGRWAVQKNGTKRASKLFDAKTPAVARARAQTKREGAELIVKDQAGTIQSRNSHGRDRPRPHGLTEETRDGRPAGGFQIASASQVWAIGRADPNLLYASATSPE